MDKAHLHLLKDTDFSPVFVLGMARSGTTILCKLLAETQCFNYVQTYHILKYNEILHNNITDNEANARKALDKYYQSLGISTRGIDHVNVNSSMPSEYGILLENHNKQGHLTIKGLLQGIFSNAPNGFFNKAKLTPQSLPLFIELAKKVQFSNDPKKPLLLKNPWDFDNFLYLYKTFPKAKFIFIHRHPMATLNSQLNGLRKTLTEKIPFFVLQSQPLSQIFDKPWMLALLRWAISAPMTARLRQALIAKDLFHRLNYYSNNINKIDNDKIIEIKYETLCTDPNLVMNKICSFLEVTPAAAFDYTALIKPRSQQLIPEIERHYAKICNKFQFYLDHNDYKHSYQQYLLGHKSL